MTAESKKHNAEQNSLIGQLLSAVDQGILSGVLKILNKGVDVNEPNKHGETALHIASGYGRLNLVKMLHQYGAYIDPEDKMGDTPLYWATRYGYSEVVQFLSKLGANVDHQNKAGETAAHVAARYGHPEVMMELGRAGANLNMRDKDDETPLLCACWHGYHMLVECLVHAGCPLVTPNKEGDSPLHVAAVRGHCDIVRLLCESGVDLDNSNCNGCTPIHLATYRNHLSIVQYLCERGCNVDIHDKNGNTPLHIACKDGHLSLVHVLYATNCCLDVINCDGATPLHLAAQKGHTEVVRYLCAAWCDIEAVDEHGLTAEETAAAAGHSHVANLIRHLRQPECRAHHINQLALGQVPLTRVKLLVCGASGVGKTEMINSLKCPTLRSLFRRRSNSDPGRRVQRHTQGFNVQATTIPGEGEFSIWDFSGLGEYYITHEPFISGNNAIIVIVFSLRSPVQTQLSQVHFWLSLLRSKQRLGEVIGCSSHIPHVILVGSFADQEHASEFQMESNGGFAATLAPDIANNGNAVLRMAITEFGRSFQFADMVHVVDTRVPQSKGMRSLRSLLGMLRQQVLKHQLWVAPMVHTLSEVIGEWRADMLPVMTWNHFFQKTRNLVNPLVTEQQLKAIAVSLHDMGDVVFINEHPLCNIIILDPHWLGSQIFGPLLSPNNSLLRTVTGQLSLDNLHCMFPQWDATSVAHLLQHFNLCIPQQGSYKFPVLIKMQALFGLWEKDQLYQVYSGVRIVCRTTADVYSPGLFPCLQLHVQNCFPDDESHEITLWIGGIKCCREGAFEACVRHLEADRAIEILVRCAEVSRRECAELLHQLYNLVVETIYQTNPKTELSRYVLSARQLQEHRADPATYSAVEIFEAERSSGLARSSSGKIQEPIADLVCCGCAGLLMAAMSTPHAFYKDTHLRTRTLLCALLDPPDPMGRNWCLLALQLGVTEEVPAIDTARDQGSPTDKLLVAWGRSGSSTVAVLVDALSGIGRPDAASVLIEGTSPYRTPKSSVVVNVSGVPLTSYLC